jgi:NAD(P)-dependent dehydrogenase (short-subunit alcohol dehydrogenase family)
LFEVDPELAKRRRIYALGGSKMSVKDLFDLSGETAIVTGAGRGLGGGMAHGLAEAGANLVIADIDLESAAKTAEDLKKAGGKAIAIKTDITKVDDIQQMVATTVEEFGRIDILVNNAGIMRTGKTPENIEEAEWKRVVDVDLTGVFLASKVVGTQMIRQKNGKIINIASMSGVIVNKNKKLTDFCAAKGGVVMLTKALASEWAQHNIRVNAIAPGYMRTDQLKGALADKKAFGEMCDLTPLKRIGEVEELKGPVVFLASKASSFMTGHILLVDGGYTVW